MKSEVRLGDGTLLDSRTSTFEVKGSYAAPPQETTVTLNPRDPGVLATSDGRITISLPGRGRDLRYRGDAETVPP